MPTGLLALELEVPEEYPDVEAVPCLCANESACNTAFQINVQNKFLLPYTLPFSSKVSL